MAQVVVREQKLGIARDAVALARRGNDARPLLEFEVLAGLVHVHIHDGTALPLAFQNLLGKRILQQALDRAAQRTGAERRVGALLRDELRRRGRQVDRHVLRDHALAQIGHHKLDNLSDLLVGERLEHDNLVDAVQELGSEQLLHLGHHAAFNLLVGKPRVVVAGKAERRRLRNLARTDVRRHDDDRVAEVDSAALRIGQAPFLENLQQDIEDVGMRLLDLVEEHDRVRLLAHRLRELAALVKADVARGRTHQTAHAVLLHVLGHIEAQKRVLGVEQELGERLGKLGLAHAGRP